MNKLSKYVLTPALIILAILILLAVLNSDTTVKALGTNNVYFAQDSWLQPTDTSQSHSPPQLEPLSQPPLPCYGPHITANISATQVLLGETVLIKGQVCPTAPNVTVRVTFTRPNYTWIDQFVTADPETGEFTVTQTLDMAGYWNIFPINLGTSAGGHICTRLYANVTDPANPLAPPPTIKLPPFKVNYTVLGLTAIGFSVGAVAAVSGKSNKTRKLSSLRLFVQIIFVFIIFFGVFIDHQNIPIPAEQIAPHEFLLGTRELGSVIPDGFSVPVLACWYPCGRTVTCPLWQMQTYFYPFWSAGTGWGITYDSSGLERLAIVFGAVIIMSIVLGRFWCGWICPFGLYEDLITRLRKALRMQHRNFSPEFNVKFHQLAYVILALLLILSVLFGAEAIAGTQLVSGTENGGFVYTYFSAPFCQVCPMKPLCVLTQSSIGIMKPEWIFSPTTGQFWQLGFYVTSLNLIILAIVTVAAFFYRRSWCRICPLGGLIALFNRFQPFKRISGVRLDKTEEKCTKCGVCKRVCPTQVTEVYEMKGGDVTTSSCILCLRCVEMCPYDSCLKFKVVGKTVFKSRNWLENKPIGIAERDNVDG